MTSVKNRIADVGHGSEARLGPMVLQLLDAIRCEARLVSDLIALQWQQRAAIEADDLLAIEDTTFGIQRVVCTLSEAHRLRGAISDVLGVVEHGSVFDLFGAVGPVAAGVLHAERARLTEVTRVLVHEVELNRALLKTALNPRVTNPCTE
jgi:hypothetical protein